MGTAVAAPVRAWRARREIEADHRLTTAATKRDTEAEVRTGSYSYSSSSSFLETPHLSKQRLIKGRESENEEEYEIEGERDSSAGLEWH